MGLTSRIVWVNKTIRDEMEESGKGFLYAFWHGRQVFLTYLHQGDALHPLISQSRDGEVIAQVCRLFGLKPIRGSTSRGGAKAVIEIKRALESGDRVAVTPDGPRGPMREVQQGTLYAAQKTDSAIVPVAYGARKKWLIKGWDNYVIPKPFNRIAMVYGNPIRLGPDDDLAKRAGDLKKALDAVTQEADVVCGGGCCD